MFLLLDGATDIVGSMARSNLASTQRQVDRRINDRTNDFTRAINSTQGGQAPPERRGLNELMSTLLTTDSNIGTAVRTLFQAVTQNSNMLSPEMRSRLPVLGRALSNTPQFSYLAQIAAFNIPQFRERLEACLSSYLQSREDGTG